MSRSNAMRRRHGAIVVCVLVLAAVGGPTSEEPAGAGTAPGGPGVVRAAEAPTGPMSMPQEIAEAPGGWRPKRPMLCAAAVAATVIAGGVLSTTPGGGVATAVAMFPVLLGACG